MMSSYDVTVRCRSYSAHDDDIIGIVAAEVKAADGRPSILTINRSCNCTNTEDMQPYSHFYIRANDTWVTRPVFTPNSRYFDEGMSCTFFGSRGTF